jgi:hypothetical protein
MILAVSVGCLFLGNIDTISDYFNTSISDYGKYKISLIDENDIKYIKSFLPSNTLDDIAKKILNNHGIGISPNEKITDEQLMGSNDRYMGNELPWDNEIGYCDIINNMDIDLYKNVQDSKIITFW